MRISDINCFSFQGCLPGKWNTVHTSTFLSMPAPSIHGQNPKVNPGSRRSRTSMIYVLDTQLRLDQTTFRLLVQDRGRTEPQSCLRALEQRWCAKATTAAGTLEVAAETLWLMLDSARYMHVYIYIYIYSYVTQASKC